MRFRNIEFRWSEINNKYELVKWYKVEEDGCEEREYCYVIAFFDKDKEGYNLRTIENRFFEDKDAFIVGKHAIEFLNAMFAVEREEEELK
jgi:5S rRNA maturation endonuclease (ribonuclease M5)